jgi:hypothetical protein
MDRIALAPSSPVRRLDPGHPGPAAGRARPHRTPAREPGLAPSVVLAGALLLLAVLLAPERPWDQEAICQRHNGVEACRVW